MGYYKKKLSDWILFDFSLTSYMATLNKTPVCAGIVGTAKIVDSAAETAV